MIYLFRWHPFSFSNLSHFQLMVLHDYVMHFCGKFWGSSTFWLSTTRITSKLSRPNLNSLVHLATVEYERAESPCVFWISFAFIPFFTKYVITAWISVFPIFTNQYTETTTKSHRYPCPAARALMSHHVFTHKGCVIIASGPRWHRGVIPRSLQTTLVH